jgi:methenyltetrahydromethanopterin cyclohydrolase
MLNCGLVASAASPLYNGPMPLLNERAHELCNALVADADQLGIIVSQLPSGTRLIDCGLTAPGSLEAGRRLAQICLSGLGDVFISSPGQNPSTTQEVSIATKSPIAACMASQYAGWAIKSEKFFAMGSGPMRAAACREELFKDIGNCERPDVCVGVLETRKLPPDAVCTDLAEKCGISPNNLTLLVAPTSSIAGTVQIVARSVETTLHKLHVLGFDLPRIVSGFGKAPLPPIADDDVIAIGRTNDAILYGGHVMLSVRGDDDSIRKIGPQVPSNSSPDYGRPFGEIFNRYNNDFYKIDPLLFSPGFVVFVNVDTGKRFEFGRLAPEVLAESFVKK